MDRHVRNPAAWMGAFEASSRALLGSNGRPHGAALGGTPASRPEAIQAMHNIPDLVGSRRRASSVFWLEATATDAFPEHDTFTEYTLSGEDTSVSSTRASTCATGTGSRQSRAWSVVVRGARMNSGSRVGYRGRSVTRRERHNPGAANRHRHPTHTPSLRRRVVEAPPIQPPSVSSFSAPFLSALPHEIQLIGEEREEDRFREGRDC
mmetsp:Transcript_29183/g.67178  ORF Transcript_29183/g.67178 Transcript_29183/m.67178 type:complete len:207 (+) Transcript_29183:95-715(+)